jgi:hypothetical protein
LDALPYYGGAFFCAVLQGWDSACVTFPEMKISCNRNRGAARVGHKRNKNQGFLIPATD